MPKYLKLFGKNLEVFLALKGMDDTVLAKKTEMPRPSLTNLRNGKGNPTLRKMEDIADALERPLFHFFIENPPLEIDRKEERIKGADNFFENVKKAPIGHLKKR